MTSAEITKTTFPKLELTNYIQMLRKSYRVEWTKLKAKQNGPDAPLLKCGWWCDIRINDGCEEYLSIDSYQFLPFDSHLHDGT